MVVAEAALGADDSAAGAAKPLSRRQRRKIALENMPVAPFVPGRAERLRAVQAERSKRRAAAAAAAQQQQRSRGSPLPAAAAARSRALFTRGNRRGGDSSFISDGAGSSDADAEGLLVAGQKGTRGYGGPTTLITPTTSSGGQPPPAGRGPVVSGAAAAATWGNEEEEEAADGVGGGGVSWGGDWPVQRQGSGEQLLKKGARRIESRRRRRALTIGEMKEALGRPAWWIEGGLVRSLFSPLTSPFTCRARAFYSRLL